MNEKLSRRDYLRTTAFASAGLALAACAPGLAPTATPAAGAAIKSASLTFLNVPWFVPGMNDVETAFANEWSKNGVNFSFAITTGADIQAKLAVAIETKQGANLVRFPQPPQAIAKSLVDVTEVAKFIGAQQDGWYPVAEKVSTVDGKWYAIPFSAATPMLIYREDWFAEAGIKDPPDTWEDLLEAGIKLKAIKHPIGITFGGVAAPNDSEAVARMLLWAYGGKEFNPDGSVALDSSQTLAALDYAIRLQKEANDSSGIGLTETGNNQAYLAGQISATFNVNTIYLSALKNNPDVAKVSNHALPPKGPAGRFSYTGFNFMGLLNSTEGIDREAGLQFMRDFFSVDNYSKWVKSGKAFQIPLGPIYEKLDVWDPDPKLVIAREIGKIARSSGYDLPASNKLVSLMVAQTTLGKMFQNAATNGNSRAALDTTLAEIETLKKQAAS